MADTSEPARKRLRPEECAAIANGLVVLGTPLFVALVLRWLQAEPNSVVVRATTPSGVVPEWVVGVVMTAVPLSPFAALATWRTHAHARCLRPGQVWAWRGVAEAVALGALLPLVVLLPVTIARGPAGVAYACAYGVLGALVGLAFGLLLTAVAIGVMRLTATSLLLQRGSRRAIDEDALT